MEAAGVEPASLNEETVASTSLLTVELSGLQLRCHPPESLSHRVGTGARVGRSPGALVRLMSPLSPSRSQSNDVGPFIRPRGLILVY